jgi:hypothetical protein
MSTSPTPTKPGERVSELEKLLAQAKSARAVFESTWYLNLAYHKGDQWVFWNRDRLDRPVLPKGRLLLVDNRIVGIVSTEQAKMTKQNPVWQVIPTSAESADLEASRVGEDIMRYLWRHLKMRKQLMSALRWSSVACAGFWKIYWDSGKGEKVTIVVDGEGNPVEHGETGAPMKPGDFPDGQLPEGLQSKMIATGDVAIETVSPFEMYVDPLAEDWDEAEWCIQQTVKSPEWVKVRFNKDLPPDAEAGPGAAESMMATVRATSGSGGYKGVRVSEYWAKPSTKYPKGCRVVWAKGQLLLEEDNPYGELPFVMFKGIDIPGRIWPSAPVEHLRGPQLELNKNRSQIAENASRVGNPAFMKSRQANVKYHGEPGETIEYDDTLQNATPSYLEPPQLPQYVTDLQQRIEQSLQDISGQHEVSSAQVPAGVTAASAINLLQEADDTRLGPRIYDMEEVLGEAGSRLLKLVAQYWTDERTIMIMGDDNAWLTRQFRGAMLKGNTHVEVQAGSAFPRSKAAKQAAIQNILNLALQYSKEALNPRVLAKVMRDYEAGGLEKLFGDLTVDEAQVNRENIELASGAGFPVNPFDNHNLHIEGHTEMQKSAAYASADEKVKQSIEAHVIEHRQQLMRSMGPQAPQVTPAESLNYKDAPADIQRQIEGQAGLTPSKEASSEQSPEASTTPSGAPEGAPTPTPST